MHWLCITETCVLYPYYCLELHFLISVCMWRLLVLQAAVMCLNDWKEIQMRKESSD